MGQIGRRGFLAGLGSVLAAPAIVHVGNIMPVVVPFHQRMYWEVYRLGRGSSLQSITEWVDGKDSRNPWTARLLENTHPVGGRVWHSWTTGGIVEGERVVREFEIRDFRTPGNHRIVGDSKITRDKDRLFGDELRRHEAFNIPRIEILKIGDRVVDKRFPGVNAQLMPWTDRRMVDDNWHVERPELARMARSVVESVPYVKLDDNLQQITYPWMKDDRKAYEARHKPESNTSRQQAMAILANARVAA